jgi:hypothetical protein
VVPGELDGRRPTLSCRCALKSGYYADEEPPICGSADRKRWPLVAEDAEFIAAANPAVMLALLARLLAAEAELQAAREDRERYQTLRSLVVKHGQIRIYWEDFADPGEPADLQWCGEIGFLDREEYLGPAKTLDEMIDTARQARRK